MGTPDFKKSFKFAISLLGITPTDSQIKKIQTHYDLLIKFNHIINLTSLANPKEIAFRLFADSLIPLEFVNSVKPCRILDIGPGGGFPSIPLGVFLDNSTPITLIEKRERVVYYLEDVIANLDLQNLKAIHERTDNIHEQFPDGFDIILNKAALQLEAFLETASTLVKPNGFALYWASNFNKNLKVFHSWEVCSIISPKKEGYRFPGLVVAFQNKRN